MHIDYIAFGAGVQSTAVLIACALGEPGFPKAEVALFADTQDEPRYVYDHIEACRAWLKDKPGAPRMEVTTAGRLSEAVFRKGGARPPLFTRNPDGTAGMIFRVCTERFKVRPMRKWLREQGVTSATAIMGISLDEAHRMRDSSVGWQTNEYPLVDQKWDRGRCIAYVKKHLGYEPQKSACNFCPFKSDDSWKDFERRHPSDFADAVSFDNRLRSGLPQLDGAPFVHSSLRPLQERPFDTGQGDLFGNDCLGACGV